MSNKLDGMSMNIEQTEMEKLKAVFPQCFAEGKLDICLSFYLHYLVQ